jgi:hypothetical protein
MQCRLRSARLLAAALSSTASAAAALPKLDLGELMERESRLKAEVKREQMADLIANGLGNPHNLFVRF